MTEYEIDDLKKVLSNHYNLYPKMQIKDFIKLIYQNEFAGGHLIKDKNNSLILLENENSNLDSLSNLPLYNYIGNNLYRLNLEPVIKTGISLEIINDFFIETANLNNGTIENFNEKLEILKDFCLENSFPFEELEIEESFKDYKSKGYPLISHSDIYRKEYSPAYRIIDYKYIMALEVFIKIDDLLKTNKTINIAIDGNCTSGKSTLAKIIEDYYDCNVFHMDDFFLTQDLRTPERLREIGGNVDYLRFYNEVILSIKTEKEFHYRRYNCKKLDFDETVNIKPKRLNIIEGSYSMHPTLIDNYDLKIFLGIDEQTQINRILNRNGKAMLSRFVNEWIPMENRYFKEMEIKEKADLVFD